MKVLKKTSFESFEQLSLLEAAQLYGGNGDGYPTDPPGCDGYSDCGCSPKGKNPPPAPNPPAPDPLPQPTPSPSKPDRSLEVKGEASRSKDGVNSYAVTISLNLGNHSTGITGKISTDGSRSLISTWKLKF